MANPLAISNKIAYNHATIQKVPIRFLNRCVIVHYYRGGDMHNCISGAAAWLMSVCTCVCAVWGGRPAGNPHTAASNTQDILTAP